MLHMFLLFSHHIHAWVYNIQVLVLQTISNLPFQIDSDIYDIFTILFPFLNRNISEHKETLKNPLLHPHYFTCKKTERPRKMK